MMRIKKTGCILMAAVMMVCSLSDINMANAAKKAALKTKSMVLNVGQTKTIVIRNKVKKRTYTFDCSKKAVVKVNKTGKVTGLKKGTVSITVKESYKAKGKKKSRKLGVCKVVVNGAQGNKNDDQVNDVAAATTAPAAQATQTAATGASATEKPTAEPTTEPTEKPTEEPTEGPAPGPTLVPSYINKNIDVDSTKEYDGSARFELGSAMLYGGFCDVTVGIKQNSGNEQTVSVGCDGKYLSFVVNGAYIDKGSMNNDTPLDVQEKEFKAASGSVAEGTVTLEVPKYTSDFNIVIKCAGKFTVDKLSINTRPCESAEYDNMVGNSLLSNGNNARIKKAIEKAKAGEDVTLAYLGGSITEGFAASETDNSDCYAETSYKLFRQAFGKGDGSNVHFINAGMSGTSSALGIIRYERDVLKQMKYGKVPDILFIDYAVNDGNDNETYEGIIRYALSQGSAVVLMFVLYTGGCAKESVYSEIGKNYDLYMVSPNQGQKTGCTNKKAFDDWFYWLENGSYGHPDVGGHRYMADCIMNMFSVVDEEVEETDNITAVLDITPKNAKSNNFIGMKTLEANTDTSELGFTIDAGGFGSEDNGQPTLQYEKDGVKAMHWFPNEWAHTSSDSNDSLKISNIKCNTIMVAYKQAGSGFGKAEVYVDDKLTKTLGNSNGGWNNASIEKIIVSDTVAEHNIEIKMASGDEEKPFTIYAIGYTDSGL